MRFSRGRIIALTILSVTIMLALLGASIFYNSRNFNSSAISESINFDPNYTPTFDSSYRRIPFGKADTGSVTIGQKTVFTLLAESYRTGTLKEFLKRNRPDQIERESYAIMKNNRREDPYPVFNNSEMRSIINGAGNSLEIPVVLLDPSANDDIVLLELTNMDDLLSVDIKRHDDANSYQIAKFVKDEDNYSFGEQVVSEQIYAGVETSISGGKGGIVYAPGSTANSKITLLELNYATNGNGGYNLEIAHGFYVYQGDNFVPAQTIGIGVTALYDLDHHHLYNVKREGYKVSVYESSDVGFENPMIIYDSKDNNLANPLVALNFDPATDNQIVSYDIGAVAYSRNTLRGMFRDQGVYEVAIRLGVKNDSITSENNLSFAFVIADKLNYRNNYPHFDPTKRESGIDNETYSYLYEGEYPAVSYHKDFFDVQIKQPSPDYDDNEADDRKLTFYNIGEYEMTSVLRYQSKYLADNYENFANRGVTRGGYLDLKHYTEYKSFLKILGFQAYYGGRHENTAYSGPQPFYDNQDANNSSDITTWLRNEAPQMLAQNHSTVVDFNQMSVGEALNYADALALFIDENGREPVRTNFSPVRLSGNVPHATGTSLDGVTNGAILSTVAFRPAYGVGNYASWNSSILEVGAPFEEAGEYIVSTYFSVNNKMCQQVFYFEIINSAQIVFEVTINGEQKILYGDDLVLNQDFEVEGNEVTIQFNGRKTLGKFEVLPLFELKSYNFGESNYYKKQRITPNDEGAFKFTLQKGRHLLTVQYGAHNNASTIFNIIVDKDHATGIKAIKAKTAVKALPNLPENIAVVGAGAVDLIWDKKLSGIAFEKVLYEFYEMDLENLSDDPNYYKMYNGIISDEDRLLNFDYFNSAMENGNVAALYSAYTLAKTADYGNYRAIPTADDQAWTVSKDGVQPLKFEKSGVYRLIIVDTLGNETPFVLIIDDSKPTFTQDTDKPTGANMVVLGNNGVKVGFGTHKLISRQDSNVFQGVMFAENSAMRKQYSDLENIFTGLENADYITQKNHHPFLKVPLDYVEISVDGGAYHRVTAADDAFDNVADPLVKGYLNLNNEGTYYFRAVDVLGNVGEFYISLTNDACLGTVYAEASPLNIISMGNNQGRGMIVANQEEPSDKTSIVSIKGGVTNRPYVTFSFMQSETTIDRVQKVYLQYYPLTFDPTSKNYPFAEKPLNDPTYKNKQNETVHIFANQNPNTGLIYEYFEDSNGIITDSNMGTIRLALFNANSDAKTPAGMYIITRVYERLGDSPTDTKGRDYYFIVDNQGMLSYQRNDAGYFVKSTDNNQEQPYTYRVYDPKKTDNVFYETPLTITFADTKNAVNAKVANAASINLNDNNLSSNRVAWIQGYNSKYTYTYFDDDTQELHKRDSIEYNIGTSLEYSNYLAYRANDVSNPKTQFSFPALAPRFSYVNAERTVDLGSGKIDVHLGDLDTGDNVYQLMITDNARNISCMLINGNLVEFLTNPNDPTSANWDMLTLQIDTKCGTQAEIIYGHEDDETKVKTNSDMEFMGTSNLGNSSYLYVVEPTKLDELQFSFQSKKNMYMEVDVDRTTASWTWTNGGVTRPIDLTQENGENDVCTFDLMPFLSNERIDDGASLSVRLITKDDKYTEYQILFDRYQPKSNLTRIKAGDNLARILHTAEIPDTYVYGLSNDFVFKVDQSTNQYLDTKEISYREVDYSGEGSMDSVLFELSNDANGTNSIPFANLVGLMDNEMRYYWITEKDYVGHKTEYMVQIQGSNYKNEITFVGAVQEDDSGDGEGSVATQIGVDMHASISSVHRFFLQNNSFRFENGDDFYMVLDQKVTWRIGNDSSSDDNEERKSEEKLIEALDKWIATATERGTKCAYTLYDRIGKEEKFECFNLNEDAPNLQLECARPSQTGSIIELKVKAENLTRLKQLSPIMFEPDLIKLYQIERKDVKTKETKVFKGFDLNLPFDIQGNVDSEYVITVTDPFGRTSMAEYHKQTESTFNFNVYGKTVENGGMIYVGDERGVDFSYLRTVYNVMITDATTRPEKPLENLQPFIRDDVISYNFKPIPNSNELKIYHIVVTGRASGAVLHDITFAFDTRFPTVQWLNASGAAIEVDNRSFVGAVTLDISKPYTTDANEKYLSGIVDPYPVFISYTRTIDDEVETVAFKKGTTIVNFDQIGAYEVTLRSTVWAKQIFKFEIVKIDDSLVSVYDDGEQIQANGSQYLYTDKNGNEINIARYVFTKSNNQSLTSAKRLSELLQLHGLDINCGRTGRKLVGNTDEETDYFATDTSSGEETLIWCLAFVTGTDANGNSLYSNPLYFATTGVEVSDLNTENIGDTPIISLKLNDNPNDPRNPADPYVMNPMINAYNIVYKNFFGKESGRKLSVKLNYTGALRDVFGAPCYKVKGNVITVDCYYNGKFVKTMDYKDEFIIEQGNAGYYEFVVHDAVGNLLYFGSSDNNKKETLEYRQSRYMLAVMTGLIVTINGQQPVNNMIYNDRVELKVNDYGKENFLAKYPQTLLLNETITQEEAKDFFNNYFKVTELEVFYNGTKLDGFTPNNNQTTFYWNQAGAYNVNLKYHIYGGKVLGPQSSDLQASYAFTIIPSTVREENYIDIPIGTQVVKLTRDGYSIHDYSVYEVRNETNGKRLVFNANDNAGNYVVTLQTFDAISLEPVYHDIQLNIQHLNNSASPYFVLSTSDLVTTNPVTIYFNPYWLYQAQGNVTITLEKDCVVQEERRVDSSVLGNRNFDSQELFNVSDAGTYLVSVRNAEGVVVYLATWTIEAKQSAFGYIVLVVVLGLAAIGILLFVRLRHRMTTK